MIKSPGTGIDKNQDSKKLKTFRTSNGNSSTTLNNTLKNTGNNTSSSDLNNNKFGLNHWLKTRSNFTLNHKPYNSKFNSEFEYKNHPSLKDVEPGHFDTVYHSLVTGRKFQQPMPLSFVMMVILHGWRKEGLVSDTVMSS